MLPDYVQIIVVAIFAIPILLIVGKAIHDKVKNLHLVK